MRLTSALSSLLGRSPRAVVRRARRHEEAWRSLSDADLRRKAGELRSRLSEGATTSSLMAEAFACVSLAAERAIRMRPFDVQLLGAVHLAQGRAVEMKTGEGKTLVATMPAFLHALAGRGVHVVTVNDYLARRDAGWMGPVYELLGLSVGCIQEDMQFAQRRPEYARDVTYVTNSELVFDCLRDNLAYRPEEIVQRGYHFAIVDEVDLLLIDEAQTPLIISGPGRDDSAAIQRADRATRSLRPDRDFRVDHKARSAFLTDEGLTHVEQLLGVGPLSDVANLPWAHVIYQALQARAVYTRDVDYIVQDGEIHIVDEHTGRVSPEKRYSHGLHQALEAKEDVPIRTENLTLAKTSYQHFFRGYPGLAGMTGTAWSVRDELRNTYRLETVRIPTHRPMIRTDYERVAYSTVAEKHDAVVEEIVEAQRIGRPVLVGTVSVEESEALAARLEKLGIAHHVLNARHHEQEARIVAQAGRPGALTISTNMAGRGTDIVLGEDDEERERVVAAGGLLVIGTAEHESARIDEQLRGRAGRQGDPGSSAYYVCIEDPVYRRFGGKALLPMIRSALTGHPRGEPITDTEILEALGELRRKVEIESEAIRLDVFKMDAVVHDRRETIWSWRRSLLGPTDPGEWMDAVLDLVTDLVARLEEQVRTEVEKIRRTDERPTEPEIWQSIVDVALQSFGDAGRDRPVLGDRDRAVACVFGEYQAAIGPAPDEALLGQQREILLQLIDLLWPQYLGDLERVEEAVWVSSYAGQDPFVEFRKQAAVMYGELIRDIELNALRTWLGARGA